VGTYQTASKLLQQPLPIPSEPQDHAGSRFKTLTSRDLIKPSGKFALATKVMNVTKGAQKHLLRQIQRRFVILDETVAPGAHPSIMTLKEFVQQGLTLSSLGLLLVTPHDFFIAGLVDVLARSGRTPLGQERGIGSKHGTPWLIS
jgi:hypothetical protein